MPAPALERREAILAAAQQQFARYGFRRTSMEDIAREAGVSRPALYLHFRNKEAIFRSLSASLQEAALADAETQLKSEGPFADRVHAALEVKVVRMLEIVHGSPHGAELLDASSRLCGDLAARSEARLQRMNWLRAFKPRLFEQLDGRVDLDLLEIPHFEPGPGEIAERRELADAVLGAIASLPPKYWLPLTMFHLDGLSYEKVARFLDIPLGTAKSLIHRARAQLRQALGAVYAEEVTPMVKEVLDEHRLPVEFAERVIGGLANVVSCGESCLQNDNPTASITISTLGTFDFITPPSSLRTWVLSGSLAAE